MELKSWRKLYLSRCTRCSTANSAISRGSKRKISARLIMMFGDFVLRAGAKTLLIESTT